MARSCLSVCRAIQYTVATVMLPHVVSKMPLCYIIAAMISVDIVAKINLDDIVSRMISVYILSFDTIAVFSTSWIFLMTS
jgi:hypothetical protein